jgi:hypothetical protein
MLDHDVVDYYTTQLDDVIDLLDLHYLLDVLV